MFGRWREDRLERSLRDQRPAPSDEFMARMSSEISRRPVRRGVARPVLAFGLTAAVCVVFAGLGGIGYASSALSGVKSHVAPTNSKGVQGSGSVENSYPNRKFKVTLSPDHVKIDKPQSADFQVTVVPRHGFSGQVKCTASIKISEKGFTGTPPTVTPTTRTFTPPKTKIFTVNSHGATAGEYRLIVICTSGDVTKKRNAEFDITS